MTVQQLIDRLKNFNPDWRVVTPGFDESRLDDLDICEVVAVVFSGPMPTPSGHCGAHKEAEPGDTSSEPAVLLNH